jgi:uncharacterized protein YodC (DUF2158 family)
MRMLAKHSKIAIAATLGVALTGTVSGPLFADAVQPNAVTESHGVPVLQSGNLVRLRSGGPLMIVEKVQGNQVICSWDDENGELRSGSFPLDLVAAPITLPRYDEN